MSSQNFIQHHYEKIILVGLLLLFSGLLYWQLSVIQNAQNQKVDQIVNQKDPEPDFRKANFMTDPHFADERVFAGMVEWSEWKNSDPKSVVDIMVPATMAACPHCYQMIPTSSFPKMNASASGTCPWSGCKKALKPRTSDVVAVQTVQVTDDENNNGIPDKWEKQHKIFDTKGNDADGDGFSNLDEFKGKTNPTDPKSHPAFATKLTLTAKPAPVAIEKMFPEKVKASFDGIMLLTGVSSSEAEFAFRAKDSRRPFRVSVEKGEDIPYRRKNSDDAGIPTCGFKVESITPGKGKAPGTAVIVSSDDKGEKLKFICTVNRPIVTPYTVISLKNRVNGKTIVTKTGDSFTLGNDKTGTETYKVISVADTAAGPELILENADKKKFKVHMRVKAPAAPAADAGFAPDQLGRGPASMINIKPNAGRF